MNFICRWNKIFAAVVCTLLIYPFTKLMVPFMLFTNTTCRFVVLLFCTQHTVYEFVRFLSSLFVFYVLFFYFFVLFMMDVLKLVNAAIIC